MKHLLTLLAAMARLHLCRADILADLECHDRVVLDGLSKLPAAQDADRVFGSSNVDHFISGFGSKQVAAVWNSVAYFNGRYTFTLQLPIEINYANCKLIRSTGPGSVQINEATKVDISTSGVAGVTEKGQWRLTEAQWKQVAQSGGDWSLAHVPISTNAPLKGFEEFVRQVREPIRNRKQGFDIPINEALRKLREQGKAFEPSNQTVSASQTQPSPNPLSCYAKVVRDGAEAFPLPQQVSKVFGASNVDHLISKFGSRTQTPVWHSITYFGGKYRFLLEVPASINYEKCELNGTMDPALIQIDEINGVQISGRGIAQAKMGRHWELTANEWERLVKDKGDWSAVNLPIKIDGAVKGFDSYVKQERARPDRERAEDLDIPIRVAVDALRYPR